MVAAALPQSDKHRCYRLASRPSIFLTLKLGKCLESRANSAAYPLLCTCHWHVHSRNKIIEQMMLGIFFPRLSFRMEILTWTHTLLEIRGFLRASMVLPPMSPRPRAPAVFFCTQGSTRLQAMHPLLMAELQA